MRQIVLDTETTGLRTEDGNRIIEIGCIELIDRKFTGKRYHQYINPQRESEEGALAVHGITSQFLQNKPLFKEIAEEFTAFIAGAELVIHNAAFDIGFINYELRLLNHKWKVVTDHCHIVDSLALAKQLHVGQRNSLDALCKRYFIDNSHRELHGALLDAHLLAQVYLAMTGGQGSLFEELTTEKPLQEVERVAISVPHVSRNLRVLKASPEELMVHQEQLEGIAKRANCLWLKEEFS